MADDEYDRDIFGVEAQASPAETSAPKKARPRLTESRARRMANRRAAEILHAASEELSWIPVGGFSSEENEVIRDMVIGFARQHEFKSI